MIDKKAVITVLFDSLIDTIKELFSENQSISKLMESSSPYIDKIILDKEKELTAKFVAGKFFVEMIGENEFHLKYQIYFKDKSDKWLEISASSDPYSLRRIAKNDQLLEKLLSERRLSFDIAKPKGSVVEKVDSSTVNKDPE